MSSGYDDRDNDRGFDDDRREDRPGRSRDDVISRARGKVATAGTLLMLSGLVGLLFLFVSVGIMFAKPTLLYDFLVDSIKNQPPSPEQQRQLKDLEDKKDQLRLDSPINMASAAVGLVTNLLTAIGGFMMRSLKGYGLSLTGAITGIIPTGGCCCLTLPIGIWALIVLVNADVKAGFTAMRSGGADDYSSDFERR